MASEVESRIASVTLYARGARIRRVTTIAHAPDARVRLVGLPAAVLDDTVRIETEGGAVVTAVHVGLDAPAATAAADEDAPEVRAGRLRVAQADAEIERIDGALAALAAAPIALADDSDEPPPAWGSIVEARRALVALRSERELALRDQAAAARRTAEEARRALTAALDRDRRAGSARPAKLRELRKHVDLELDGTGPATVHLEYQIAAARWTPGYVARLDGEKVAFELRAMIAQDSGEDWTGVALRLSTAEPERFGALPELAAQRIGRRQAEPARPGFRAPPTGAQALFLDYTRAFPDGEPTRRIGFTRISGDLAKDKEDAAETIVDRGGGGFALPPPPPMPPAPAALPGGMPPPAPRAFASVAKTRMSAPMAAPLAGGPPPAQPAPPPPPAAPPPQLDYGSLRMASPHSEDRGTLIAAPRDKRAAALEAEVALATARVTSLALPPGYSTDWPHTYDYAFTADGMIDVPSDGAWHSIAVTAMTCTARLRHVAVPREQADAFRLATITNPLAGPLLPGPIDVYDRGAFLVTSSVDHTPPAGVLHVGLGVDPAVKLARNTEFREETTGVLRGGLRLHHAIKIDIDNLSDRAIDLEVRERLPVTREDDDDVEIVVGRIEPTWERYSPDAAGSREPRLRGGYRWRLQLPPKGKRALRAAYEVRISGKHELVGGNRRES